jgi:hypothetical protein
MAKKPASITRLAALAAALFTATVLAPPYRQVQATLSATTTQTTTALGNGVTVLYTIGFTYLANSHIEVYRQDESVSPYTQTQLTYANTLTPGAAQFSITNAAGTVLGNPSTTVKVGTAPSATQRLIIKRVTARTQSVHYDSAAAFPAVSHESQMDRMTMILQELDYNTLRIDGSKPLVSNWNAGAYDITASHFVGALTGNADTATALAANPSDCGAGTFATAIAANGNLSCASIGPSFVTGFVALDGSTPLTSNWNAGAFDITAQTFIGSLTGNVTGNVTGNLTGAVTGNASTATALAANPADCASDTYATTIAASGALTCAAITNASTTAASANTASAIVARDGSGNFAAGTITANLTGNVTGALTGNASTATALAANPAACPGGQFVIDTAANGDLTCSTPVGAGDVTGPAASVDNELVLYSGISGKLLKRASGNGAVSVSSGVVTQGTLSVSNGGSGAATLTDHGVVISHGTSALTSVAPSTANKVLMSDGTDWASTALTLAAMPARDVFVGTPQTGDGAISSGTYTSLGVTITFTPTHTGKYRVYGMSPMYTSSTSVRADVIIQASSGSPTVNFAQVANVSTTGYEDVYVYTIVTLTASSSYTFQMQAKVTSGSVTSSGSTTTNGVALIAEQID